MRSEPDPSRARRAPAPWIAAFDLLLAGIYLAVGRTFDWTSDHAFGTGAALLAGVAVVMGGAALIPGRRAWLVSVVGCVLLLGATALILALLVASAGFLWGVYGAFGRHAALLTIGAAAVALELGGLPPAFQLRYLLSDAGRHAWRQAP